MGHGAGITVVRVSWEVGMEFVRAVSKVSSSSRGSIKKLNKSDLDGWDLCSMKLRFYQLDGLSGLVQRADACDGTCREYRNDVMHDNLVVSCQGR